MPRIPEFVTVLPKRYWITILAFIGDILIALIRMNSDSAAERMIKRRFENDAEMIWSENEKTIFMSSLWHAVPFGTIFSVLGGPMIVNMGGFSTYGIGVALIALLNLCVPFILKYRWFAVILFCKFLIGILIGIVKGALVDIFAHWSPVSSRTRLLTIAAAGETTYMAVIRLNSFFVLDKSGEETTIYIAGVIGLIWSGIWLYFCSNDPREDKFISEDERSYLSKNTEEIAIRNDTGVTIQWKRIFILVSILALLTQYFTESFPLNFMKNYMSVYLQETKGFSKKDTDTIDHITGLCGFGAIFTSACLFDYLRWKNVTNSKIHKSYHLGGILVVFSSFLVVALQNSLSVCTVCYCMVRIALKFCKVSNLVICIDMAGQYAAIIRTIGVSLEAIGYFFHHYITLHMLREESPDHSLWNGYLFSIFCISVGGCIFFLLCGSGELQSWAKRSEEEEETGTRLAEYRS